MSYFDDASLVMIPSGYKTSKVYSVKPTDGTGDLTFTRSNDTATRVGPDGLIEKVRTNLILRSQELNNAYWTADDCTVTANQTTAPDGTSTADLVTASAGGSFPRVAVSYTIADNVIVTQSSFVKANTANSFRLISIQKDGATGSSAVFNLSNGAVSDLQNVISATATAFGNGWYRCAITFNVGSGGSSITYRAVSHNVSTIGGNEFTDGRSLYCWGTQLEVSDFGATPYIATTSAAVSVGPVANVPRLDYLNSSCPRLLLEPQRTNLVTYSEQINNADWSKDGSTVTSNQTTSPSGYVDSDLITNNGGASDHSVYQLENISAVAYTFSGYVKKNTEQYVFFTLNRQTDSGEWATATFNLDAGTSSNYGSVMAAPTSTITNVGNGWYRVSMTATVINAATYIAIIGFGKAGAPDTSRGRYIANNTNSFYLWGAQLEAGAYATSYIPTLGAAVTRGADAASKTGISSLIGQTEGTLFIEVTDWQLALDTVMFSVSDGTLNNYIQISTNSVTGNLQSVIFAGGGGDVLGITTPTAGQTLKVAVGYKLNDYALYVNGVQIGTLTSKAAPSALTRTDVGSLAWITTGLQPRPKFAQALLFPTRLSNSSLAELTSL